MSEETKTEDEPSIEEILDSIRQIISEDDEDGGEAENSEPEPEAVAEPELQEVSAEPEPAEELDPSAIDDIDFEAPVEVSEEAESESKDDEVLELTELVNTEDNQLDVDMQEGPEEQEEAEVIEEVAEPDIIEEVAEPEIVEESSPTPVHAAREDSLLTDSAETAAISAMTELVRKTAVEHNGVTLEDIVRVELKPLLRDWLDKHLPTVIERLVQEELERVSKRVLDE